MQESNVGTGAPVAPRPVLPVRLSRYARRIARDRLRGKARPDFDEARDLRQQWHWSACYAPATSMYFDQFGKVRACCQNTGHLLGDVNQSTLTDIWRGERTRTLRRALEAADLGHGCDFCAWEISEAGPVGSFSRSYDRHPVGPLHNPRWPNQLEFAVSNTCNLQCVMCNGDWSSSIRAQREHRPPLPNAYPERFYDELVAFIPHLRHAQFTGGEPFLGREPLRILGLLDEHGSERLRVTIVTNATVLTTRVEELVTRLQPNLVVSLDGGTAETYERIRIGARFDEVIANIAHFQDLLTDAKAEMSLTHCLMVDNWPTFPDLLQLAEDRHLEVGINTVRFPERHSLYHLLPRQLAEVVGGLQARSAQMERSLTGPRLDTWHRELARLRTRSESGAWPEALGVLSTEQRDAGRSTATPVTLGRRRVP